MKLFIAITLLASAAATSNILLNVGGDNTWVSGNCYVGHSSGVKTSSTGVMTDGVVNSRKGYWHACRSSGAWAKFRLPYVSDIDSVSVWNRADCCEGRIDGATASLVDVNGKEHRCNGSFKNNGRGAKTTVTCPNVAANYVIVRAGGRGHLHFSEVQALGNRHTVKNLLLNVGAKNTWVSGNCYVGHSSGVKTSSTGVMTDGVVNSRKGYWHSCKSRGAWAEFRLKETSNIQAVEVFNRADCCEGRLNGAYAEVKSDGKWHRCTGSFKNHGRGTPSTVTCNAGLSASHIRVRAGHGHFHVSEVRAFGESAAPKSSCPVSCKWSGRHIAVKHAQHDGTYKKHKCYHDGKNCQCECA